MHAVKLGDSPRHRFSVQSGVLVHLESLFRAKNKTGEASKYLSWCAGAALLYCEVCRLVSDAPVHYSPVNRYTRYIVLRGWFGN